MNINDKNLESLIQNYVLGRLNETEASEFEEYFLSKPDVIEQVEIAQYMHTALRESEAASVSNTTKSLNAHTRRINTKSQISTQSLYEKLIKLVTIPVPAFAVLAMAAIMLPMTLKTANQQIPNSDVRLVSFSTQTTRSSDQEVAIDLTNNIGNFAILVKLKSVEFQHYKLKLSSLDENRPLWESKPFEVSALRDKLISLPTNSLGKVIVEVVGIDQNEKETNVDFCHYSENCN